MATNRSGHRPGGGIASRVNVKAPVRIGDGSHSVRPAGVAQLGYSVGDHSTSNGRSTGYQDEKLHSPQRDFHPVPLGNEVALNVKGGGPGTGRNLHHCGSQGQWGQPVAGNPPPNRHRDPLNND